MSLSTGSGDFNDKSFNQLPKDLQSTFYPETPNKVFWLSFISLGTYSLLWFYRHWRHFKRRSVECKRLNLENSLKYEEDIRIIPFWSAWFCHFYIVGTARRIRERLKSLGSSEWQTGPWWAFVLFSIHYPLSKYESTESIRLNIAVDLLWIIAIAIHSWQITRLQIKANHSIILSQEMESIKKARYTKWDIVCLVFGLIVFPLFVFGLIFPLD